MAILLEGLRDKIGLKTANTVKIRLDSHISSGIFSVFLFLEDG
jgi:hypothetical protein